MTKVWQRQFDKQGLNFKSISHRIKSRRDKLSKGREKRKVLLTSNLKILYIRRNKLGDIEKAKRTYLWL